MLCRYEGRVQFSWREWCPTAINIVDYCMGTGQSLLPVAHAWLWVIRRVQLAEEAKEKASSSSSSPSNNSNDSEDDAAELARQSEKLTADFHRRMALVKLNAFRAKRSEMIGHPEGMSPFYFCVHSPACHHPIHCRLSGFINSNSFSRACVSLHPPEFVDGPTEPEPSEAADTGLYPRELVKTVTAEQAAQPNFKPLQPFVGCVFVKSQHYSQCVLRGTDANGQVLLTHLK